MGAKGVSKYANKWIVGQRIGSWEVVDPMIVVDRYAKLLCRCICGRIERLVDCYSLASGTSTQCEKCGNSMKLDRNPAWKGHGTITGKYIGRTERRAKLIGLKYDLSPEFLLILLEKQNYKCALSGLDIHFNDDTASLDRIDSSQGYLEDNTQWVHKDINRMKNLYNQDYFIFMCKRVVDTTCGIC